jgi:YfiH family protein
MNLGAHCGDRAEDVARNRALLQSLLPGPLRWIKQVHGNEVDCRLTPGLEAGESIDEEFSPGQGPVARTEADAQAAFTHGTVCAVMTADCLPVFFSDLEGTRVAVAHAGWRGLANGILQSTVSSLDADPGRLLAWLGPSISGSVYEVGAEVVTAFNQGTVDVSAAFTARNDRWLLDMNLAARTILSRLGLTQVFGGSMCTYQDSERFFSHRRDGTTGRMAHVIWFDNGAKNV